MRVRPSSTVTRSGTSSRSWKLSSPSTLGVTASAIPCFSFARLRLAARRGALPAARRATLTLQSRFEDPALHPAAARDRVEELAAVHAFVDQRDGELLARDQALAHQDLARGAILELTLGLAARRDAHGVALVALADLRLEDVAA